MTHPQMLYLLLVVVGFVIFVGTMMWATISTALSGGHSDNTGHGQAHVDQRH